MGGDIVPDEGEVRKMYERMLGSMLRWAQPLERYPTVRLNLPRFPHEKTVETVPDSVLSHCSPG